MKELRNAKGKYGINIIAYMSEHEQYIDEQRHSDCDHKALSEYHCQKIQWIQHERLIHLLVTIVTVILFLFCFALILFYDANLLTVALLIIVAALLIAYVIHYFRLENGVQRWYRIYEEIINDDK